MRGTSAQPPRRSSYLADPPGGLLHQPAALAPPSMAPARLTARAVSPPPLLPPPAGSCCRPERRSHGRRACLSHARLPYRRTRSCPCNGPFRSSTRPPRGKSRRGGGWPRRHRTSTDSNDPPRATRLSHPVARCAGRRAGPCPDPWGSRSRSSRGTLGRRWNCDCLPRLPVRHIRRLS